MTTTALCVSIEASGDRLLAHLISVFKRLCTIQPTLIGIGGERSQSLGLSSLIDPRQLAAHGLTEAISVLPATLAALRLLKLNCHRADILFLVDAPEINLRLLRWVRSHRDERVRSLPIIYLAPPQAWAWRAQRVQTIALANEVGCLFPFETEWMSTRGVHAHYIGHPLVPPNLSHHQSTQGQEESNHQNSKLVIALFPGSRKSSVRRAIPLAIESIVEYLDHRREHSNHTTEVEVRLAHTSWVSDQIYHDTIMKTCRKLIDRGKINPLRRSSPKSIQTLSHHFVWRSLKGWSLTLSMCSQNTCVPAHTLHPALNGAKIAICHAGTSTIECAIAGVPTITIAPLSILSQIVIKRLAQVDHCALPNLCLNERAFPEHSLDGCTSDQIAKSMEELIIDLQPSLEAIDRLRSILKPLSEEHLKSMIASCMT